MQSVMSSFEYDRNIITSEDKVIIKRAIVIILKRNGLEYSNKKVEEILAVISTGGKINISKNVYFIAKEGKFYLSIQIMKKKK